MGEATGTRAFVFTDVEGSTRRLQADPDTYPELLACADEAIRAAVAANDGEVVDSQGDGLFAVFDEVPHAVEAALAAQQALGDPSRWRGAAPLAVRMGVHAGAVAQTAIGLVGLAIHQAARVAAAAHGGQVVVSDAARLLAVGALAPGVELRDLGAHRLKDLADEQRLFQLVHPDLPDEFPPIRSLSSVRHNLPVQLTSFVGREDELRKVAKTIDGARLCTLTGTGGSGKTRLALQVAADVAEDFPDGVWMADLSPLGDAADVGPAIAHALGLRDPGSGTLNGAVVATERDPVERTVDRVRFAHLLLVLDNCEHVVEAVARAVQSLLRSCPSVRVLATSREPLGVDGEVVLRVPPLPVPDATAPPEILAASDGVRLFLERAAQRRPDVMVDDATLVAVADICRRVDGIPFAIELAAARTRAVSIPQLATMLQDRLGLLTGGSRTASARQQTLHALIDWSYRLLDDGERRLLQSVSVFAGGFDLAAAHAVCAPPGATPLDTFDGICALADRSLVEVDRVVDGEDRYRLLETIREFAAAELETSGGAVDVRRRHRRYFADLAESAGPELKGPSQRRWYDVLEREHDNLRSALDDGLADVTTGDGIDDAARLAVGLRHFWLVRGYLGEGREALERIAARLDRADPRRVAALAAGSGLAAFAGGAAAAREQAEEVVALAREIGFEEAEAVALRTLGLAAAAEGRLDDARVLQEEAARRSRSIGDDWALAFTLQNLANLDAANGDLGAARAGLAESLAMRRRLGDTWGVAWATFRLGNVVLAQGHLDEARGLLRESLAEATSIGFRQGATIASLALGDVAYAEADALGALAAYRETLRLAREVEDRASAASALAGMSGATLLAGDLVAASEVLDDPVLDDPDLGNATRSRTHTARGRIAYAAGDDVGAALQHRLALRARRRSGDRRSLPEPAEDLAAALLSTEPEKAALLATAASAARHRMGMPPPPIRRGLVDALAAAAPPDGGAPRSAAVDTLDTFDLVDVVDAVLDDA